MREWESRYKIEEPAAETINKLIDKLKKNQEETFLKMIPGL